MRYRAVLVGVVSEDEKPKQIFGQVLNTVEQWADGILEKVDLEKWPAAHVVIYETTERAHSRVGHDKSRTSLVATY